MVLWILCHLLYLEPFFRREPLECPRAQVRGMFLGSCALICAKWFSVWAVGDWSLARSVQCRELQGIQIWIQFFLFYAHLCHLRSTSLDHCSAIQMNSHTLKQHFCLLTSLWAFITVILTVGLCHLCFCHTEVHLRWPTLNVLIRRRMHTPGIANGKGWAYLCCAFSFWLLKWQWFHWWDFQRKNAFILALLLCHLYLPCNARWKIFPWWE